MRGRRYLKVLWLLCLFCLLTGGKVQAADGWKTTESGRFYYVKGKVAKGFVKIKNKLCYFDKNGKLVKNSWIFKKGVKYRADKNGTIICGRFAKVEGNVYYFGDNGGVKKSWKTIGGKVYYFGRDGVRRTGLQTIYGKTYLFSSKGVRLSGVQKIGKTTYYLSDKGVVKAKSVTSKGTTRYYDGTGKALDQKVSQHYIALAQAKKVIDQVTRPGMSDSQKLKACFDWVIRKPYVTRRIFSNVDGWPAVYANDHFLLGGGNCFSDGAAFAYLAKALGYKKVYVCVDSDGRNGAGHGWAEVDGLAYDPLFAEAKSYDRYYGVPYSTYELHPILHIPLEV